MGLVAYGEVEGCFLVDLGRDLFPADDQEKVGRVTRDQLRQIAERKMEDLNANDVEAAMNIIAGTARSMGIEVEVG